MVGVYLQCFLIMLHRFVEGSEFAVAVAKHALRVGVVWIFLDGFSQMANGRLIIFGLDRLPPRCNIRIFGVDFGAGKSASARVGSSAKLSSNEKPTIENS